MTKIGFFTTQTKLTLCIIPGFERCNDLLPKPGKYRTAKACLYIEGPYDVNVDILRH